jgi:transposase
MRMQKLRINNPKQIESQIYEYLHRSDEAKYIHRLHGILLLLNNEENNCSNVASLFRNSPRSLSNWVHQINKSGSIFVLKDKPRTGRKPKLNDEQLHLLKAVIQKHPSDLDLTANIWDGKTLSFFVEREFGIKLQVRQCQRLFRKLGFSLKRARPIVAKGDPQKKEQAKKTFRK